MQTRRKKALAIICNISFLLFISSQLFATVLTYPLQSCFDKENLTTVTINQSGIDYNVPVRKFSSHGLVFYDYAHFSFSGPITIKVSNLGGNIISYKIQPNSYNMTGSVSGMDLTFTLEESRYIKVIINGSARPLFILADPLETVVPNASGTGIYNITSSPYNADSTGLTNTTTSIQNAINAANSAGGGTVYVPSGIYKITKLTAKSNVNIYLKGGAVLKRLSYAEGAISGDAQMIEVKNVSNVKIYGRGTIWCNAAAANNNLDPEHSTNVALVSGIRFTDNSTIIGVDGVIVSESATFSVASYSGSNNITIKNTKIMNYTDWHWNDGFDVPGGHNVDVSHCMYVGADDASCLKPLLGYPVHDIHYSDMVMQSEYASGFKSGADAGDKLYNVLAENYRVIYCARGVNFDHWYGAGDWGGNIIVRNFWIDEVIGAHTSTLSASKYQSCPIRLVISPGGDKASTGCGPIHDILLDNINYPTGPNDSYLMGNSATNNISNIEFRNCKFNGNAVTSALAGSFQEFGYLSNITYTEVAPNGLLSAKQDKSKLQVYPNPCDGKLTINYKSSDYLPISLKVYNLQGVLVKTLIEQKNLQLGIDGTIVWNAGSSVASGTYFVQMIAGNENLIKKVVLLNRNAGGK